MTAFLGLYNGALDSKTGIGHASPSVRISNFAAHGARPVYVNCPIEPLLNSTIQNLCAGK